MLLLLDITVLYIILRFICSWFFQPLSGKGILTEDRTIGGLISRADVASLVSDGRVPKLQEAKRKICFIFPRKWGSSLTFVFPLFHGTDGSSDNENPVQEGHRIQDILRYRFGQSE